MDYTKDLDNDYVPALNLNFGYGVHSAYFTGADVIMGAETSWTHPWLADWGMLDDLCMDENNCWFRKIIEGFGYLKEFQSGDYCISGFSNAGPGDMANAIRGNDLFTDLYDEPEMVYTLLDKCADAAIWLEEAVRNTAGIASAEGSVTANCWFSQHSLYLSEDFWDLCAPEQYEAFGERYTQKIIGHFGGAFIHHHAKGAHIHASLAKLKGLSLLEQSWDPSCSRPVDRLDELMEIHQANNLPLMICCHANDVYEHINEMKRGRVVLMLRADNLEQSKDVMRFIRKHSKI
jgi:hypothetical protein